MIGFVFLLDNSVSREIDFFVVENMESEDIDEEKLKVRWYIVYIMFKELLVVFVNYLLRLVCGNLEEVFEELNMFMF